MADELRHEEWPFTPKDWVPESLTAHWLSTRPESEQTKLILTAARIAVNVGSTPSDELARLRKLAEG